nr:MAG TPA: hypothetical protein [Caudoviricetes sp.]
MKYKETHMCLFIFFMIFSIGGFYDKTHQE